jgi:protein SCO1/2
MILAWRFLRTTVALLLLAAFFAVVAVAGDEGDESPGGEATEINPRYLLMDAAGRSVTNEDFAGRFQLIAFGYTSCPDVCPSTLAAMTLILHQLGDQAAGVQPIFISVDPERDTPEVLRRYTENFDARILGLTGSPELVRGAADHYRVTYRKYAEPGAPPGRYAVDHSVGMYLVGPDGRFLTKYAYSVSPREIADRIRVRLDATRRARVQQTGQ